MKSADMKVKAYRLATEEDWLERRRIFEALEAECPLSPYLNWAYTHECWNTFTFEVPNWMILVYGPAGRPVAGTIWREYTNKDRLLAKNVIRTFDHIFFMRVPPMLVKTGFEAPVYRALAEAAGYLNKTTGAETADLYRLDRAAAKPLAQVLEEEGKPFRFDFFTEAPWLTMGEDFDQWIVENHRKAIKAVPRKMRRLEDLYGGEPNLERVQAHQLSDPEYESCLKRYNGIFEGSWQYEWQAQAEEVDNDLTNLFTRRAFDIWRDKYVLNFYFLVAGQTSLAYIVALEYEGLVDNLLMGYTQECKKWSPGELTFISFIRNCHQRGLRAIDLGGELLEWKQRWSNHIDHAIHMEWALGGLGGKVWSVAKRLKKG